MTSSYKSIAIAGIICNRMVAEQQTHIDTFQYLVTRMTSPFIKLRTVHVPIHFIYAR
jgi:hypothetical protein